MIGMFIKELRENAKWAGAIFGVITLTVLSLMRRGSPNLLFDLADPPMLVFVPMAGLLMGVVQTLFETKPDNWAFVVHRPVSRRGIFTAKSSAGLALLMISLEAPCLMAAAWASRPGHLRMPFQWRMLLPSLAVVLSASCYYFAGMVLTLRKARWWGTRLLPLGGAVVVTFALRLVPEFWQAAAIIVVGSAAGAVAAWGAFATAGEMDRGFVSRVGLGAMIYVGGVGIGVGIAALSVIFQSAKMWSWWKLDRDGNVLRVTTTLHGQQRSTVVSDLSGRVIPELDGVDLEDPAYADRFVRFGNGLLDERLMPWPVSVVVYEDSYLHAVRGVIGLPRVAKAGARMSAACVFDVEKRTIDMYDRTSRTIMGRVGPAGYAAGRAMPAELFPGKPLTPWGQASTHTLAFESAVYWMELDHRRVRKIFTAVADAPVVAATELPPLTDPTVLVATQTTVHVMRPSGEIVSTLRLEHGLSRTSYSVAILPSNHHLVMWGAALSPTGKRQPALLEFALDGKGTLVRRQETPLFEYHSSVARPRLATLAAVYPVAGIPLYEQWQWSWLMDLGPEKGRFFYEWAVGSGILCAVAALMLGRRYGLGWGKTIGWATGGLVLGPGALLAMAGLNEMPALELCVACGGKRLAGRRKCRMCEADIEPTVAEGREIFEPMVGVMA